MSSSRFQIPLLSVTNVKPRLLVIGGQFSGTFVCRELRRDFEITLVDAKEFMEFTPGILRAFVRPSHFDSLSFTLQPVMEKMAVKFVAGEVKKLSFEDGEVLAAVKVLDPGQGTEVDSEGMALLAFEYCVICSGCNFGPFSKWGESLWFPTIHEAARKESEWPDIDERYLEEVTASHQCPVPKTTYPGGTREAGGTECQARRCAGGGRRFHRRRMGHGTAALFSSASADYRRCFAQMLGTTAGACCQVLREIHEQSWHQAGL